LLDTHASSRDIARLRSRYLALASSSHAFDRRLSKLESKPAILVRARSSAPIVEASVRTSATLPDPRFISISAFPAPLRLQELSFSLARTAANYGSLFNRTERNLL
jgi:hypothetical protein